MKAGVSYRSAASNGRVAWRDVAAFTLLALLVVRVVGAVALEALFPNAPDFVIDLVDNYTPAVAALLMLVREQGGYQLAGTAGAMAPPCVGGTPSRAAHPDRRTRRGRSWAGRFGTETGEPLWLAIPALVAVTLLMVFGEEYGWRGYLLPKLLSLGEVRASLIVGVIWGSGTSRTHCRSPPRPTRSPSSSSTSSPTRRCHRCSPGSSWFQGEAWPLFGSSTRELQRVPHASLRAPHGCRPAVVRQPHSRPYCDDFCLGVLAASLGQHSHRSLAPAGDGPRKTTGKRRSPAAGCCAPAGVRPGTSPASEALGRISDAYHDYDHQRASVSARLTREHPGR